jgi:hypothetical protein
MYAADRACINTLAQVNAICERLSEGIGLALDLYHVWWDPNLEGSIDSIPSKGFSPFRSVTGWRSRWTSMTAG